MKEIMVGLILLGIISLSQLNFNQPLNDNINFNQDRIWVEFETADGRWSTPIIHNVVTNVGLNYTRDILFYNGAAPTTSNMTLMALANGTVPAAASTSLNSEIVGCGLDRALSTPSNQPGNGNVTISYKWTMNSSCSNVLINTTGTFNATSAGTLLGAGTFTQATLQPNDNITVNHNYKLS